MGRRQIRLVCAYDHVLLRSGSGAVKTQNIVSKHEHADYSCMLEVGGCLHLQVVEVPAGHVPDNQVSPGGKLGMQQ